MQSCNRGFESDSNGAQFVPGTGWQFWLDDTGQLFPESLGFPGNTTAKTQPPLQGVGFYFFIPQLDFRQIVLERDVNFLVVAD
ncbi:hypothetical protein YDYSG_19740 [Paenibacillus tyrfis]|nr:hypothetical protein YDYSG_19740 [Paenibacillus tyrfis]